MILMTEKEDLSQGIFFSRELADRQGSRWWQTKGLSFRNLKMKNLFYSFPGHILLLSFFLKKNLFSQVWRTWLLHSIPPKEIDEAHHQSDINDLIHWYSFNNMWTTCSINKSNPSQRKRKLPPGSGLKWHLYHHASGKPDCDLARLVIVQTSLPQSWQ